MFGYGFDKRTIYGILIALVIFNIMNKYLLLQIISEVIFPSFILPLKIYMNFSHIITSLIAYLSLTNLLKS